MKNNAAHEALVRELLLNLSSLKLGRFWKNPRGVAMTRRGQVMTFGIDGQADISGILIGGYRAEVEAKTGQGKLGNDQINFKNMIQNWNGFYHEARDVDGTIQALKAFLANRTPPNLFYTK